MSPSNLGISPQRLIIWTVRFLLVMTLALVVWSATWTSSPDVIQIDYPRVLSAELPGPPRAILALGLGVSAGIILYDWLQEGASSRDPAWGRWLHGFIAGLVGLAVMPFAIPRTLPSPDPSVGTSPCAVPLAANELVYSVAIEQPPAAYANSSFSVSVISHLAQQALPNALFCVPVTTQGDGAQRQYKDEISLITAMQTKGGDGVLPEHVWPKTRTWVISVPEAAANSQVLLVEIRLADDHENPSALFQRASEVRLINPLQVPPILQPALGLVSLVSATMVNAVGAVLIVLKLVKESRKLAGGHPGGRGTDRAAGDRLRQDAAALKSLFDTIQGKAEEARNTLATSLTTVQETHARVSQWSADGPTHSEAFDPLLAGLTRVTREVQTATHAVGLTNSTLQSVDRLLTDWIKRCATPADMT